MATDVEKMNASRFVRCGERRTVQYLLKQGMDRHDIAAWMGVALGYVTHLLEEGGTRLKLDSK